MLKYEEQSNVAEYAAWVTAYLAFLRRMADTTYPMQLGTRYVNYLQVYPPTTEANRPGRLDAHGYKRGWYERHVGAYSTAGNLTKASEQMATKWQLESPGAGQVAAFNTASYWEVVQHKESQREYHAARDWRNDEQAVAVVEEYAETNGPDFVLRIPLAALD